MHADHLSCSFPKLVFEYVSATKKFSSINFYHLVENVFVFVYVNNNVGAVVPTSFRYTDTAFVLVTFSLQYKHGQHTYDSHTIITCSLLLYIPRASCCCRELQYSCTDQKLCLYAQKQYFPRMPTRRCYFYPGRFAGRDYFCGRKQYVYEQHGIGRWR